MYGSWEDGSDSEGSRYVLIAWSLGGVTVRNNSCGCLFCCQIGLPEICFVLFDAAIWHVVDGTRRGWMGLMGSTIATLQKV